MIQENLPVILFSRPVNEEDGDCACAGDGFAADYAPAVSEGLWQVAPDLYRAALPDAYELVSPIAGPSSVVVLNEPARRLLDRFAVPCSLADAMDPQGAPAQAIRSLAALNLLRPLDQPLPAIGAQAHTLTAWLHLTNACNIDCTYCYLAKNHESMDEATGRSALETIFRTAQQHHFGRVKLKYAGGEPTLNFALVRTLHEVAVGLAQGSGLDYEEVLLSNGISLTHAMLDTLRDSGIRLMISLDSLNSSADQRVFQNGRHSSALAVQAVDRALARSVRPHLSITVSEHTAGDLAEVVAFALDRNLRFNVNLVRDRHHVPSPAAQETIIAGLRAALAVLEARLPAESLTGMLVDLARFNHPHQYACGAGHSYLVIDQHGRVSRCQMDMAAPISDIWQADPLLAIHTSNVVNTSVDHKADCRDCSWRYWCAGGCPLLSSGRSPYCAVYQAIYPELLRLEGLRLLSYERSAAVH